MENFTGCLNVNSNSGMEWAGEIAPKFQQITYQDIRMKRGRRRISGAERTVSGRISRKKTGGTYVVYVCYFPQSQIVKIGRTGDVGQRMKQLIIDQGERPIVCAEYHYASRVESAEAEALMIGFVRGLGDTFQGREWFSVAADDLPRLVHGFTAIAKDTLCIRSMGQFSDARENPAQDVNRSLFGHLINEMRI